MKYTHESSFLPEEASKEIAGRTIGEDHRSKMRIEGL